MIRLIGLTKMIASILADDDEEFPDFGAFYARYLTALPLAAVIAAAVYLYLKGRGIPVDECAECESLFINPDEFHLYCEKCHDKRECLMVGGDCYHCKRGKYCVPDVP